MPSTRKLNFLFISTISDFTKSETVVGQIFQSAMVKSGSYFGFAVGLYSFAKRIRSIRGEGSFLLALISGLKALVRFW